MIADFKIQGYRDFVGFASPANHKISNHKIGPFPSGHLAILVGFANNKTVTI